MYLTSALLTFSLASLTLLSNAFPLVPQQPAIRRRVAYSVVAVDGGPAPTSSITNAPGATTVIHIQDQTETVTVPAVTLPATTQTILSTAVVSESKPAKTVEVSVTQAFTETVSASSTPATASLKPAYAIVNAGGTPASATTVLPTTQTSYASTTVDYTFSIAVPTAASASTSTTISSSSSASSISSSAPASTSMFVISSTMTDLRTVYSTLPPQSAAAMGTGSPSMGAPLPAGLAPLSSSGFTTPAAQPMTTLRTYDNGMWHTRSPSWNATSTTLSSSATAAIARGPHNMWNK